MAVSDGAIIYDDIFRTLAGMLSIPVAFETFKLKRMATLFTLISTNTRCGGSIADCLRWT